MAHEITLQQAALRADHANVTLFMLRKAIIDMDYPDIETALTMASKLMESVTAWLLEEQHQRENAQ
ncbi:hypothetical protein [Pantoea coffeiphila]|uniref:hypothetical protein n=1 Tax=Pantoea coffeiphila TaxID=1465635 RepID=UPI00195F4D0F|nr:hypothetical protein [Pantoea coffeiphila]MBM7342727.1 hypothetical protein [Pantoea coffeiphila]